ncbi:uncharacterized protein BDZ99DRAFT_463302 [Mytilinidion resinicola]|uniref:Uncharacterized protein n=1 Tax=Mytilinidion resinicola TaxID=574789 RepID=A0A6A6YKX2_9PEZI|nr:uncharacterized protein BDZ99DRAFT_463302 [Mytilinidion resinicola]KAF2809522.1 hypothetical protein BDZ99DRAFT_463302 [Mytilinidion resinicola]
MSTAKPSRVKTVQSSRIGVPSSAVYNPSDHYVPCMSEGCQAHYILSMLSPSFYAPSKPYGLVNKHGLCPSHAFKDRQLAEAHLKSENGRLRATAGRRTMREVQQLFEQHVKDMVRGREADSNALLRHQEAVLHSKAFKYYERPCTKENCQRPWYSVYAASLFKMYNTVDENGIGMLTVYCPRCATAEVDEVDSKIESAKFRCKTDEEFARFVTELRRRRAVQIEFWEKAQVRVMLQKGVKPKIIAVEDPLEDDDKLEGKGVEFVREACSVM